MTNLTRFEQDGIEIVIDTTTGESFASISGYSRMSGLSKQAISKRCTVNQIDLKKAEMVTTTGTKTVNLLTESTITKWIIKDNPEMAEKLMQAGVRVYLHKVAGYEVTSTAVVQPEVIEKQSIPQALPPVRDSIDYARLMEITGLTNDTYLKFQVRQLAIKEISLLVSRDAALREANAKEGLLIPSAPPARVSTCTVRATELGYKIEGDNGIALGKYVKSKVPPLENKVQEGRYQVWAYIVSDKLDRTIHDYYAV